VAEGIGPEFKPQYLKTTKNACHEDMGKKELLYTADGDAS
jgi:hypothetical protein